MQRLALEQAAAVALAAAKGQAAIAARQQDLERAQALTRAAQRTLMHLSNALPPENSSRLHSWNKRKTAPNTLLAGTFRVSTLARRMSSLNHRRLSSTLTPTERLTTIRLRARHPSTSRCRSAAQIRRMISATGDAAR